MQHTQHETSYGACEIYDWIEHNEATHSESTAPSIADEGLLAKQNLP